MWVPEKTSRQIALLDAHPDLAMIFSDMRAFEGDRRSETTYFQERGFSGACNASSVFLFDMVSTPTVIVRRSVLTACGGFDESLGVGQDTDLWFRIALRHRFAAISEPLVLRRFHGSNITKDARRLAAAVVEIWGRYLGAVVEREPHMRRAILADYAAKRWHHHFLEGCAALHERRRSDARRRFFEAILARPGAARTYAFLGATFLGDGALRKLGVAMPAGQEAWVDRSQGARTGRRQRRDRGVQLRVVHRADAPLRPRSDVRIGERRLPRRKRRPDRRWEP